MTLGPPDETTEGSAAGLPLEVCPGDTLGAPLGPGDDSLNTLGRTEGSAGGFSPGIWLGDTTPIGPRDGNCDTLGETEGAAAGLLLVGGFGGSEADTTGLLAWLGDGSFLGA